MNMNSCMYAPFLAAVLNPWSWPQALAALPPDAVVAAASPRKLEERKLRAALEALRSKRMAAPKVPAAPALHAASTAPAAGPAVAPALPAGGWGEWLGMARDFIGRLPIIGPRLSKVRPKC